MLECIPRGVLYCFPSLYPSPKDTGHECPFFDGNKHRFKDVQSLPEAQLRESMTLVRTVCDNAFHLRATTADT